MKDPNDSKTSELAITLYRIGYTFVNPDGRLRSGVLVVEATSGESAKDAARIKLQSNYPNFRITTVKQY